MERRDVRGDDGADREGVQGITGHPVCCGGQRGRYSPLPAVKRLPLGSRLTLLAQDRRTSEEL